MEESTYEILKIFLGLENKRSIKKTVLRDELVKRGVSPYGVVDVVDSIAFQIGNAADNRIYEIDSQLDETHEEMTERMFLKKSIELKHEEVADEEVSDGNALSVPDAFVRDKFQTYQEVIEEEYNKEVTDEEG